LGDTIIELFISNEAQPNPQHIESTVTAYTHALSDAMERVLGAPSGSFDRPECAERMVSAIGEAIPSTDLIGA
jgi:hypothetical protein